MTHTRTLYPLIAILTLLALLVASDARSAEGRERDLSYTVSGEELIIRIKGDYAELTIEPSASSRSGSVEAEWKDERCDVDIDYDSGKNRLTIDIDAPWNKNDSDNCSDSCNSKMELTVTVPTEPALNLTVDLKAAESNLRLGGLSLERFHLDNKAGETNVDFAEHNRIECRHFEIDCIAGEVNLHNLGNARIENGDVDALVGELNMDFNGSAPMDTRFDIDLDIGETDIEIPSDLGTRISYSKLPLISEVSMPCEMTKTGGKRHEMNYDSSDRRVSMHISAGIGEYSVKITPPCITRR